MKSREGVEISAGNVEQILPRLETDIFGVELNKKQQINQNILLDNNPCKFINTGRTMNNKIEGNQDQNFSSGKTINKANRRQ